VQVTLHAVSLRLEHEFTISRGSRTSQPSLIVQLSGGNQNGYGEAISYEFYGHSIESMTDSIQRCRPLLERYEFGTPEELWERLADQLPKDKFALSAIDEAAHDLYGKLMKRPTYENLGLQRGILPDSSYTIGIDSIATMVTKLHQHAGWSIYKIKLGTSDDVDIVRELRKHTDAILRVDANGGWSADETIQNSHVLKELGVEFIEQPLPRDTDRNELRRVFAGSALPLIADESCQTESDVAECDGVFHGVNVKLCKCGGITPAVRMLRDARSRGLKTMIGCMVESSVGISAAAQLLPLLDYADLDGAALLSNDPAEGVNVTSGKIDLGDKPGNGVTLTTTEG
jgi:L-Ala-D/L-Glu epimerase